MVGGYYMDARDKLVEAIDKEREVELLHPYFGTLTVQCDSYTMSESSENKYSTEFQDAEAAVDDVADELDEAETDLFAEDFSVDGMPEYVEADALGVLMDFFSDIGNAICSIEAAPSMARESKI